MLIREGFATGFMVVEGSAIEAGADALNLRSSEATISGFRESGQEDDQLSRIVEVW